MHQSKFEPRCIELNGRTYVGVTSAMKLVRQMIGEPDDYYGPPALARIHQMEGTACHAACLDWLAHTFHMLPEYVAPTWPVIHGDERRWKNVLSLAIIAFQEFVDEYEVEPIAIEQEAFSSTYGLVGHLDLYCSLKWKRSRVKAVTDLKFVASLMESHRLQVRCYGRLDQFRDAQIGLLFHCDRNTGKWKIEPVDLRANLKDVLAVSYAAQLWEWKESRLTHKQEVL